MTKTKTEKRFDTVRMMRSARDELNAKTWGMTFEEERAYLRERLRESTRRVAAWPQEAAASDGTDPTGERGVVELTTVPSRGAREVRGHEKAESDPSCG